MNDIEKLKNRVKKLEARNQELWQQLKTVCGLLNTFADSVYRAYPLLDFPPDEKFILESFLKEINQIKDEIPGYKEAIRKMHATIRKHESKS